MKISEFVTLCQRLGHCFNLRDDRTSAAPTPLRPTSLLFDLKNFNYVQCSEIVKFIDIIDIIDFMYP